MTRLSDLKRAPNGLGPAGRRLWHSIADGYELSAVEAEVLLQACRAEDVAARLSRLLAGVAPVLVKGGMAYSNPLVADLRRYQLLVANLLGRLRVEEPQAGRMTASDSARIVALHRWRKAKDAS